jgi:hypothetical protein
MARTRSAERIGENSAENPARVSSAGSGRADRCNGAMPAFSANLCRARDRRRHAVDISPAGERYGLSGIHFPRHVPFRLRVWCSFGLHGRRRLTIVRLWNTPWQAPQFTHIGSLVIRRRGRRRFCFSKWVCRFLSTFRRIATFNATPIPKKRGLGCRAQKGELVQIVGGSRQACRMRSGHGKRPPPSRRIG